MCLYAGTWSAWSYVGSCNAVCGQGKLLKERECPEGRHCNGENVDEEACESGISCNGKLILCFYFSVCPCQ